MPGTDDELTDRWILDALPATAFVIDELGTVIAAGARASELVARPLDEVIGSSILEYVDPDATWAYAAAMSFATTDDYADTFGGPVRVEVHPRDGRRVQLELWTSNRLEGDGPDGVVVLLTPANAALGIAEAVTSAVDGAPLAEVASACARALGGFPVIADAAVMTVDVDGSVGLLASAGAPSTLVDGTGGTELFVQAVRSGERVVFAEADDVPGPLRDLLPAAGYQTMWIEPIAVAGEPATGALVVLRRHRGEPTPNELSYVVQAAGVLALATLRSGRDGAGTDAVTG